VDVSLFILSLPYVFRNASIGDCYVAVAGLPTPREDHAVVMARFARECMRKMNEVTKKLEVSLGPETGDLTMRFGLHSGPVTAGVLRGEKSRFQLFGDTVRKVTRNSIKFGMIFLFLNKYSLYSFVQVNTAARMESTGLKNRIHCSKETAELLVQQGKRKWLEAREDKVIAKGKGELSTFWISSKEDSRKAGSSLGDPETEDNGNLEEGQRKKQSKMDLAATELASKNERLAGWISELLLLLLKQLVASRPPKKVTQEEKHAIHQLEQVIGGDERTILEETPSYVSLPEFEDDFVASSLDDVELGPKVEIQLKKYVLAVASLYHDNPFHNFEHCAHVSMSVRK
jgi:hypothetical protein